MVYLTWTTPSYWQHEERHRVPLVYGQQLMLHADFKKRSENVSRTNVSIISMELVKKHYLQQGKGSLRGEIYSFFNKRKRETEQHRETRRRGAGSREQWWRGRVRAQGWMICACVQTSTSITTKSMMLQRLLWSEGSGRRALVFRAFRFLFSFFCLCCYFIILLCIGG